MNKCEVCGCKTEILVGCCVCGRLIGPCCEAAVPDDEAEDPICEECF